MLGPFSATVLDYEPRTRLPRHHHAPATLSLILEGAQRETVGSRQYDCPVHSRRDDPRLRRAMDYLEANYRTRLTVAEVAAQSGIHPSYLAELFREAYGSSVGEWVRNRRLEFARDALRNPAMPISCIAVKAGFADQSHLTRMFRAALVKAIQEQNLEWFEYWLLRKP